MVTLAIMLIDEPTEEEGEEDSKMSGSPNVDVRDLICDEELNTTSEERESEKRTEQKGRRGRREMRVDIE